MHFLLGSAAHAVPAASRIAGHALSKVYYNCIERMKSAWHVHFTALGIPFHALIKRKIVMYCTLLTQNKKCMVYDTVTEFE
jgi:hypothetical protein